MCGRRGAVRVIVHVQGRDAAAGTLPRARRPLVRVVVVARAGHLDTARKDAALGIVQRAQVRQPHQGHLAHGGTRNDDVMLLIQERAKPVPAGRELSSGFVLKRLQRQRGATRRCPPCDGR